MITSLKELSRTGAWAAPINYYGSAEESCGGFLIY